MLAAGPTTTEVPSGLYLTSPKTFGGVGVENGYKGDGVERVEEDEGVGDVDEGEDVLGRKTKYRTVAMIPTKTRTVAPIFKFRYLSALIFVFNHKKNLT